MDGVNWHTFFFMLFSLVACGFAVGVVLSSNIVRMALYLIISLGATAGIFFLAGADFVGSMQLMIYVGGTLVLLIFGVMLTSTGPFVSMKTSGGDWVVAALLSGCLAAMLIPAAFSVPAWRGGSVADAESADAEETASPDVAQASDPRMRLAAMNASEADEAHSSDDPAHGDDDADAAAYAPPPQENTATRLGEGLLGVRVDKLEEGDESLKAGMSGYLLPFEIVSVHLLVVLVGAAYLARTKRRKDLATS